MYRLFNPAVAGLVALAAFGLAGNGAGATRIDELCARPAEAPRLMQEVVWNVVTSYPKTGVKAHDL